MSKELKNLVNKKEYIIIFLCWLVYTSAYLGKYSFISNTPVIGPYYGVDKAEVGLVGSVFFIIYGIGQVVNALFCKYYPKRSVITSALFVSSAINLTLFFDIPFEYIKYIWGINAAAQSVLWPTLLQTISMYIRKCNIKIAALTMSSTIAVGTVISYTISALFVQFANFKITFLVTAVCLIIVALFWNFSFGITTKNINPVSNEDDDKNEYTSSDIAIKEKKHINTFFFISLGCLIIFAIINNFVKDGLNTWVPNILKEMYNLPDSLSIILTITLSIIGLFGAITSTFLHKYIKDFVIMCGLFFALSILLIACVLQLFNTELWGLVLVCFSAISLLMHAINNIITNMFALYMKDNSKAGFYSGLMNGACYIGSALSAYGLGKFADSRGWTYVFYLLMFCCLITILISLLYISVKFLYKNNRGKKVSQ